MNIHKTTLSTFLLALSAVPSACFATPTELNKHAETEQDCRPPLYMLFGCTREDLQKFVDKTVSSPKHTGTLSRNGDSIWFKDFQAADQYRLYYHERRVSHVRRDSTVYGRLQERSAVVNSRQNALYAQLVALSLLKEHEYEEALFALDKRTSPPAEQLINVQRLDSMQSSTKHLLQTEFDETVAKQGAATSPEQGNQLALYKQTSSISEAIDNIYARLIEDQQNQKIDNAAQSKLLLELHALYLQRSPLFKKLRDLNWVADLAQAQRTKNRIDKLLKKS